MEEDSSEFAEKTPDHNMEADKSEDGDQEEEERDPESNSLIQPLLKRNRTLSTNPLAMVGAKVSHIESLDYE